MKEQKLAEFLLSQWYGANTRLARGMWVCPESITNTIRRGLIRESAKKRYILAINRVFGTNITVADIFENKE